MRFVFDSDEELKAISTQFELCLGELEWSKTEKDSARSGAPLPFTFRFFKLKLELWWLCCLIPCKKGKASVAKVYETPKVAKKIVFVSEWLQRRTFNITFNVILRLNELWGASRKSIRFCCKRGKIFRFSLRFSILKSASATSRHKIIKWWKVQKSYCLDIFQLFQWFYYFALLQQNSMERNRVESSGGYFANIWKQFIEISLSKLLQFIPLTARISRLSSAFIMQEEM